MHPILAFLAFWRVLFGGKQVLALPAADDDKAVDSPKVVERVVERVIEKPAPKASTAASQREGALALLAREQREGRFVDFISEQIDGADDADIGAAVRAVHRGCKEVFDQILSLEPVMPGEEEAKVDAPYKGTLRHHGWRAGETKLPSLAEGVDRSVIAPAEVELSA